ncbi:MAG: helix-turn-helix transcriptional regulator [Flammeovirgaceae bacterium]|nr:helix-turn-helix transcriptional regulator [Flammeovirgaceae bacterium]
MKYIDPFVLINILMILSGTAYYVLVIKRKGVRIPSSKFLGVLILVLAAIITGFTVRAIYGMDVLAAIMLFVPPLFYTYVYSKIHDGLPPHFGFHFLPGLLFCIFFLGASFIFNINESVWSEYYYWIVIASNFSYTTASVKLYFDGRKVKANRRIIFFIKPIAIISTVLLITLLVMIVLRNAFVHDYILTYYVTLAISFSSHYFITDLMSVFTSPAKYQKSTLSEDSKKELAYKIISQMKTEKYYLNRFSSLNDLARKVNSSPNYVSQVINENLSTTYLELIANYRIKEAQQMLQCSDIDLNMEQIAEKVGYNSKSAFYQAFRRLTGMTPIEFKGNSADEILKV